jgi:hypothetical protein
MIDLHTHSNFSDGSETPSRVVELAAGAGCSAVALTDHDTTDGLAEARRRAQQLGITLVGGAELSCAHPSGGGMHVLVYFLDDGPSPLHEELARLQDDRAVRNQELVDRLQQLGLPVTWEAVVEQAGRPEGVGRPHFASVLIAAGVVGSQQEAFDRYLGNRAPTYVPKARLTGPEAARLARESGAVSVLAHPHTLGLEGHDLANAIAELAGAGFAGLEVTYGRYSPRQRQSMGHLAERFGLVPTGGSDFHGRTTPDLTVGTGTGDLKVADRVLDQLHDRRPA